MRCRVILSSLDEETPSVPLVRGRKKAEFLVQVTLSLSKGAPKDPRILMLDMGFTPIWLRLPIFGFFPFRRVLSREARDVT